LGGGHFLAAVGFPADVHGGGTIRRAWNASSTERACRVPIRFQWSLMHMKIAKRRSSNFQVTAAVRACPHCGSEMIRVELIAAVPFRIPPDTS
jgi:hypothetical protein